MAKDDLKKFIIYSLFLGILILPMVGFPGRNFEAARAFTIWVGIVGVLAIWLLNKTIRRSDVYKRTATHFTPLKETVRRQFSMLPTKYYVLLLLIAVGIYPLLANNYMVDVGITCLIYIVLGLGLNIVVGLAGLLDLGYIAFYAVGAYSYSLLNLHFGISFWSSIPIGIVIGAICGCIIGYPTLRMRGDYLAIVTMGFGEIIRLVLNNWDKHEIVKRVQGLQRINDPL